MLKNKSGELIPLEWEDVLEGVSQALRGVKGNQVGAIVGGLVDAEVQLDIFDFRYHY